MMKILSHLPEKMATCRTIRISANKDTAAMARMVQKWRKPTNPVGQERLTTYAEAKGSQDGNEENLLQDSSHRSAAAG
jgi:hypothetical protein